jgi:hypothetical protein
MAKTARQLFPKTPAKLLRRGFLFCVVASALMTFPGFLMPAETGALPAGGTPEQQTGHIVYSPKNRKLLLRIATMGLIQATKGRISSCVPRVFS